MLNALWASRYRRTEVKLSERGDLGSLDHHEDDNDSVHANWRQRELPLEKDALVLCARTAKGSDACAGVEENLWRRRRDVGMLYLASRIVASTRALLTKYRALLCAPGGRALHSSTCRLHVSTFGRIR